MERAEGVGRAGRAEWAGMHWGPLSQGAWGHGAMGSVHGGGGGVRAGRAGRAGMHWGH